MVHRCNERCRIRIGPGNSENDFRCRKIHSVLGSSDPTKHVYMKIVSTYHPIAMDILTKIGLYVDGNFMHPFFDPKRHMPPCNLNAKCNMSPVISDFFVGLKSMMNSQAILTDWQNMYASTLEILMTVTTQYYVKMCIPVNLCLERHTCITPK